MIDDVRSVCLNMIEQQGEVSLTALTQGLAARGFSQLSRASVQEVLSTLVIDSLVRRPPFMPHCHGPTVACF